MGLKLALISKKFWFMFGKPQLPSSCNENVINIVFKSHHVSNFDVQKYFLKNLTLNFDQSGHFEDDRD